MSNDRLAAQLETRTFYFTVLNKKDNQIQISMYGTLYTLVKTDDGWKNASTNLMNMSQPLIDSVVAVSLSEA